LTGILSKEFFYKNTQRIIRENPQKSYDIVCCDIENFKLVNDMFGVKTGDELLKYLAQLLEERIDGRGICGRLGADTFGVLLEHREDYSNEMFECSTA
ncbi:MAG: diguanylate cyclase, partial [Oscillospiraceae bacterium]